MAHFPIFSSLQRLPGSCVPFGTILFSSPDPRVGRLVGVKVQSSLTHVVKGLVTANFYNLLGTLKQARTQLSQSQQLLNALTFDRQTTETALSSMQVECSVRVGPSVDEAVAVARQAAIDVVGLLEFKTVSFDSLGLSLLLRQQPLLVSVPTCSRW